MNRLSEALRLYIRVNDLEQKVIADEIGISQSSLTRLLQGKMLDAGSFARLMVWLTQPEAVTKLIPCIWCDARFSNKIALANHFDNVHKGGEDDK